MARLRSAPSAAPSPSAAQNKRQALREKTNTTRSAKTAPAPVYEDDGNTDGLVKDAKTRRGRSKKSSQAPEELVMTGGLGLQTSDPPAVSTDELAKSDASVPPTVKPNRRPPRMTRKPIQNEAQSKVLEGLKKRMQHQARKETGEDTIVLAATKLNSIDAAPSSDFLSAAPGLARQSIRLARDLSEYDMPTSPPPAGKSSSAKRKRSSVAAPPTSVLRPQPTPAMDTSVLKNFRRRPRQPSMLAMVQQRAAGARPSNVNATTIMTAEDASVYDFDIGTDDDEEAFAPNAEGTPMRLGKQKRKSASSSAVKKDATKPASRSRAAINKRKSGEADLSTGSLSTLRAKRQRPETFAPEHDDVAADEEHDLAFVNHPAASATRRSTTASARGPTPPALETTDDVQIINPSQSSPPPSVGLPDDEGRRDSLDDYVVPSTEEQHQVEPEDEQVGEELHDNPLADVPNGTMAEPASSSPGPNPVSGTQQRLREELADPVTQLSPQPERRKKPEKVKQMSTAALQSLLPKRRQPAKPRHRKSEYDFTSDSENEGGVEEVAVIDHDSEPNGRRRRQTKITPAKGRRKTATAHTKSAKTGKAGKAPATRARKFTAASATDKQPVKTYGRRTTAATTSDKENNDGFEDLDDADTTTNLPEQSMYEATKSNELEEARRKFAEVDEWDMEFESLGDEEHRSSSQGWR
ncbi:hypothetical protein LTR78_001616 [Recurvomyces mirabilis]|uniref:Uncharacterized protein n=1 Tax=Recurvomyces mirabilis TaxID=574656 RepID=A0AAE1C535_9PEZI|nr:hypothetical protein LTR78_001616 [Recurvomyces mirabilis]KAK5151812.1 hypothetical protein LTS14_008946 [Recurvomyces mirabilis]